MIKASNLFVHGSKKLFQILNNIPSQVLTSKKDKNKTQNAATVEKIKNWKWIFQILRNNIIQAQSLAYSYDCQFLTRYKLVNKKGTVKDGFLETI